MKITIHDQRKIHEIQKEFSQVFPSLKICFFAEPEKSGNEKHNKILVHHLKSISVCRKMHTKGELTISPEMTIAELKKGLNDTFGLSVQVYHKIGDNWLETASDAWTLEHHNAKASELNAENTLERI